VILLHRIVTDMLVEVETQGEPAFVTALGMLDMAREQIYERS
jgi:hypothetical protein